MEHKKMINMLDNNTSNQPSRLRTKTWVETMITQVECI